MKLSVLASSSSGNSVYIEDDNFRCLVDVGLTGKKITENLDQIGRDIKDINAIFVTHEHIDHIKVLVFLLVSIIFQFMQINLLGII